AAFMAVALPAAPGRLSAIVWPGQSGPGAAGSVPAYTGAAQPVRRECRRRPGAGSAVFSVRSLFADQLVARGFAAGQPAGRVESLQHAALECRLPRQYQPANELLA